MPPARAGIAQLVERNLAKVEVASSNLVSRSALYFYMQLAMLIFSFGGMAEWLCSGLQSRARRFDSDSRLRCSHARVVELADTRDLKSFARKGRAGSNPAPGTPMPPPLFCWRKAT